MLKVVERLWRSNQHLDHLVFARFFEASLATAERVFVPANQEENQMSTTAKTPNGMDPVAAAATDAAAAAAALKASRVALIAKAREAKAQKAAMAAGVSAAAVVAAAVTAEEPLSDADKAKLKKVRAKEAKAKKEARPPLPEETKPAPEIPAQQVKAELTIEDIIADDSGDDDDLAIEAPSGILIRTKFPKADFVRIAPGVALVVNTIRLDEEDRKPNQLELFVLPRGLKRYVVEQLNHSVTKMAVRVGVTLHGHPFFLMHPVSSELAGNRYNSTRAEAIHDAEKDWIKVRTDTIGQRYKWAKRNPRLALVEPVFPSDPFGAPSEPGAKNLFLRSLGASLIDDENHRVMKRLRGEEDEEDLGGDVE
jgi:hypothetical protein